MTDEQINAAIRKITHCDEHWMLPRVYTHDLNAMHEAEELLKGRQFEAYGIKLNDIEGSLWGIRATARQRAEAFLRTLGKWEDGK